MRLRARKARSVLRDRRRGVDDRPALIGPLSAFDLYLLNLYSQVAFVVDIQYRARKLVETEERIAAFQAATHRPRTRMPLMRAMLPRYHDGLRVEGWRDGSGTMMFLASDPDRPSTVYRRRLGHGTVSAG